MHDALTHLALIDEEDIVLDMAALAVAAPDHAGVDLVPYHDLLAGVAARLRAVSGEADTAALRGEALARVLADEFGFAGDRETYDHPDNADLLRVIDRRRGLPVSLSILWVAAARRVGWAAEVLNVPGHVLVLLGGGPAPAIVDPFRGGVAVDAREVAALVAAYTAAPAPPVREVTAMPNRAVLVRLLLNAATRAEAAGHGRRALTLYARMTTIAPDHGHPWWERARLELVDGDTDAARASLSAMLEITREPTLRARVADLLGRLTPAG